MNCYKVKVPNDVACVYCHIPCGFPRKEQFKQIPRGSRCHYVPCLHGNKDCDSCSRFWLLLNSLSSRGLRSGCAHHSGLGRNFFPSALRILRKDSYFPSSGSRLLFLFPLLVLSLPPVNTRRVYAHTCFVGPVKPRHP